MGYLLSRIKTAIQAAADAAGDYVKIGYGNPAGSQVHVEGIGWFDRGKAWSKDRGGDVGLLDLLLEEGLVAELERAPTQFCTFLVNGSGVAPTLEHNDGCVSVSKFESGIPPAGTCDYVTVTLQNAYKDTAFAAFVYVYNTAAVPIVTPQTATSVKIAAVDVAGAAIDLNGLTMGLLAKGNLP